MTLAEIPRNDLAACRRYYRASGESISMEEFRVMLDLQDDQGGLEAMSESWDVSDWLDDLKRLPL